MTLSLSSLLLGATLSLKGIQIAVDSPAVREKFYHALIICASATLVSTLLARILLYTPLHIASLLFAPFLENEGESVVRAWIDVFWHSVQQGIGSLPLSVLFLLQYVYPRPLHDLFFVVLQQTAPEIHSALVVRPYHRHSKGDLRNHLRRTARRLMLTLAVYLASKIPVVGVLAVPAATYYLLSRTFGKLVAAAVAFAPLVVYPDILRPLAFRLLHSVVTRRQLARELMEPYFGRVDMSAKEKSRWFAERQSTMLGFVVVLHTLIGLPYVGAAFYVIAQASIACLLPHLNLNLDRTTSGKSQ